MTEDASSEAHLEDLHRRWEEERTPRLLLQLAEEYGHLGRFREAVTVLEQGLLQRPDYLAARVALGRYRLELGRAREAGETLEGVLARDPTQLVANRLLVEAYLELGEAAKARERLAFYSQLNQGDAGIEELERRIDRLEFGPRQGEIFVLPRISTRMPDLAALFGRRRTRPAPVAGETGFAPVPVAAPAPPDDGAPFAVIERHADAAAHLRWLASEGIFPVAAAPRAVAARPPDAEPATVTLGELYLDQGHLWRAEEIFRRVLERDPASARARRGLAAIAARRRRPVTASELLAGEPPPAGVQGKILVLRRYLGRLVRRGD